MVVCSEHPSNTIKNHNKSPQILWRSEMTLIKNLLNDEAGFVVSSELVLISTIAVIGLIAGLSTLRDGVVQELADVSGAIGNISQSYTYNSVTGHSSGTNGSAFQDQTDFCEVDTNNGSGTAPSCLQFTAVGGGPEGATTVTPSNP
jgi:hypothetical protein